MSNPRCSFEHRSCLIFSVIVAGAWSLPRSPSSPVGAATLAFDREAIEWWSQTGSNRRPHACKARALPTELWPRLSGQSAGSAKMVGLGRLELPTSRLSSARSNQLSYKPDEASSSGFAAHWRKTTTEKGRETRTAARRQLF